MVAWCKDYIVQSEVMQKLIKCNNGITNWGRVKNAHIWLCLQWINVRDVWFRCEEEAIKSECLHIQAPVHFPRRLKGEMLGWQPSLMLPAFLIQCTVKMTGWKEVVSLSWTRQCSPLSVQVRVVMSKAGAVPGWEEYCQNTFCRVCEVGEYLVDMSNLFGCLKVKV